MQPAKPHVISIGYGRHMFTDGDVERQRLQGCAAQTTHLHAVVFARRSHGLHTQTVSDSFTLHPTNARTSVAMVWAAVRAVRDIIATQPDAQWIVTTQDPFASGIAGVLVKRTLPHVHLTVQEHGDVYSNHYWSHESLRNWVLLRVGAWVLRAADTIRVVSQRTQAYMSKTYPQAQVTRLPVAIAARQFTAALPSSATNRDPATFQLLWVGRFAKQKNLPMLLRAFAAVHAQQPHVRLRLVGKGELFDEVSRLTADMFPDASTRPVELLGWRTDVGQLMLQADAYVLSSHYEGWARVLIEAMLSGLPTVTTDVGCAGEVLQHNVHGLVVPVDDQVAFTNAVLRLVTNDTLRHTIHDNLRGVSATDLPGVGMADYGRAWVTALR